MSDMRAVIVPKSDQLNGDDLIAGPISITITDVKIRSDTEQPVSVFFEGDNGKPYKPCKSMCKVMVFCWGDDSKKYKGHRMTLYRDPTVPWGGLPVGGIRISHMTGIEREKVMVLTETRKSKKPFTVKPLKEAPAAPSATPAAANHEDDPIDVKNANDLVKFFEEAEDMKAHLELVDLNQKAVADLKEFAPRLWKRVVEPAIKASYARNTPKAEPAAEVENDPALADGVEGY